MQHMQVSAAGSASGRGDAAHSLAEEAQSAHGTPMSARGEFVYSSRKLVGAAATPVPDRQVRSFSEAHPRVEELCLLIAICQSF